MVKMGMGQEEAVDLSRVKREWTPVHRLSFMTLVHATLNQYLVIPSLQKVA
jgi:antibiotic biosynthesis monooxygenase (ABM) superfamily enzyme